MNNSPQFDFDDSKPRTTTLRYSEYQSWLDAHPNRIVFAIHDDHAGTYRIDWKPGEQRGDNLTKIPVAPVTPA